MSLERRLHNLEVRQRGERWCRCPFSMARFRRDVLPLMGTAGARTPDRCATCGRAKLATEFYALEEAAAWQGDAP